MKIRPLADKIVVEPTTESTTKSGIVIPETAEGKPMQGLVLNVGKGKVDTNGKIQPPQVNPGDKVLFGKYSGTAVKLDNKEVLIMREEDIMGVLE